MEITVNSSSAFRRVNLKRFLIQRQIRYVKTCTELTFCLEGKMSLITNCEVSILNFIYLM